ncbi:MAG: gamma-glutamyl-gamma-aminobutyrate hydrolase family protein [Candidatus Melainabacteria bacterium]|nr:gamma-glutamyl-gamma-aminobutyrate hydrolase family protein [Candidatus Melainabacteria bacterium]
MKHFSIAALLSILAFFSLLLPDAVRAEETKELTSGKPLIGVNCDIYGDRPRLIGLSAPYIQALKNAGAIAVLLPPMPQADLSRVLNTLDGVMMIGGDDYPPSLYGQKVASKTEVMDEERWRFDILLAKTVVDNTRLPFLGICAGCQALNISLGGSLVQDIPTKFPDMKVAHASKDGWLKGFNRHEVRFAKLTKLKGIYGIDSLNVPTSHHQCVDKPGDELAIAATTDDGVVEAIELKGQRFVVGVQWHPERDFPANRHLFKNFVEAANKVAAGEKKAGKKNGGETASETASLQKRLLAE